jgi:hypothetical protein
METETLTFDPPLPIDDFDNVDLDLLAGLLEDGDGSLSLCE